MAEITVVNPPSMGATLGQYSQIMRVKTTELVFIAGQIASESSRKCSRTACILRQRYWSLIAWLGSLTCWK